MTEEIFEIEVKLDGIEHKITSDRPSYDPGNEVLCIRESIEEVYESIKSKEDQKKIVEAKIEDLKRKYTSEIRLLNDELIQLKQAVEPAMQIIRTKSKELERAERVLREALDAERVREEFQKKTLEFDKITAGFSWREFAFEHQIEGAKYLASAKRAILGDAMGLGKTLTSLIACDMLKAQKILVVVPDDIVSNFLKEIKHWAPHRTPVLLGKQTVAVRHTVLDTVLPIMSEFIAVINYSAWRSDAPMLDKIIKLRLDTIILDEAHSIKNTRTSAFKGINKLALADNQCPKCFEAVQLVHMSSTDRETLFKEAGVMITHPSYYACAGNQSTTSSVMASSKFDSSKGCGWNQIVDQTAKVTRPYGAMRSVKHVFPMTGTPLLNKPSDLYPLLHIIDDKAFDSQKNFENAFCHVGYDGRVTFKSGGLESLTKKLGGRYIARTRQTAGVVLPEQTIVVHDIEMDHEKYPKQAKVIRDLSRHAMLIFDDETKNIPALQVIELILRKRQANVWPGGINLKDPETGMVIFSVEEEVKESIKLDKIIGWDKESRSVVGLAPELVESGERVVIFSQFKSPLIELERRMNKVGIRVARFDGDTPQSKRDTIKIDFDRKFTGESNYQFDVLLCNYRTGGVGLNFTAATQIIILDEEWNPGKAEQAYGRVHRIGQTEKSTVHILRLARTIDEWMANLIEGKKAMIDGFDNATEVLDLLKFNMMEGEL